MQTMLLAWLQMRNSGGTFVLRMEDLDAQRTRAGAEEAIYRDLCWLGFDWDEGPGVGGPHAPYRQSERALSYDLALRALAPRIYPCTCTRRELDGAAETHQGESPYPGLCRSGPRRPGAPSSLRIRVEDEFVAWEDGVLGHCTQRPANVCGDFIVRAKGGGHVYQLAVVVDDLEMGITDVLRGEDLWDSTGRQLLLWRWLGGRPPRFAHAPLLREKDGQRLAKSRGSPGIGELRSAGADPRDVVGRVAVGLGLLREGERAWPQELIGQSGPWSVLRAGPEGQVVPMGPVSGVRRPGR